MGILEYGLGLAAWLITGYTWGKISNSEFFDNTPTEKLSRLRKLKRLLLFPIKYHDWKTRQNAIKDSCPLAPRFIANTDGLSTQEAEKERYCKVLAYVWPLQLVPLAISAIEIIFYGFCFTASLPYRALRMFASGIESLQLQLRNSSGVLQRKKEIAGLIEKLDFKMREIESEAETADDNLLKVRSNLDNWQNLYPACDASENGVYKLMRAMEKEIAAMKTKKEKAASYFRNLAEKRAELDFAKRCILQCEATLELGIPVKVFAEEGALIASDGAAVAAKEIESYAEKAIWETEEMLNGGTYGDR